MFQFFQLLNYLVSFVNNVSFALVWKSSKISIDWLLFFCRENYLFNCACVKCQAEADDDDVTSDDMDDNESDCMDS